MLDREVMVEIVEALSKMVELKPGDRVKTLRGSAHGVVVALKPDGRVVWRPDTGAVELLVLPESLLPE